jgi:hypothetical protein
MSGLLESTMPDAPSLRTRAANFRHLAEFSTAKFYEDLLQLASEYEAEAAAIEAISGGQGTRGIRHAGLMPGS